MLRNKCFKVDSALNLIFVTFLKVSHCENKLMFPAVGRIEST